MESEKTNLQHSEEIPVTTLASGYRLALPLHRIAGAEPGPTLGWLTEQIAHTITTQFVPSTCQPSNRFTPPDPFNSQTDVVCRPADFHPKSPLNLQ